MKNGNDMKKILNDFRLHSRKIIKFKINENLMSILKASAALLFVSIVSGEERFLQDYDPSKEFKGLGSVGPAAPPTGAAPTGAAVSPIGNIVVDPVHMMDSAVGLTLSSLSAAAVMLAVL